MDTVSGGHNKQRPNSEAIKKIKGRVFHLPLPLENSLQKLPDPKEAILKDQDLSVIVRSIPNNKKHVWQSIVDVKKIYEALTWLKKNNPLYRSIQIPDEEKLLDDIDLNLIDSELNDDDDQNVRKSEVQMGDEKKMITQKSELDDFYENLTIYPLVESRMNADPARVYQLLKIRDENIDNRGATLDLMCFPDLFCTGQNGQHEERKTKLQPLDFFKCLISSVHSRFRLNLQYLFFLLNQVNIRQISTGISHKLNITKSAPGLDKKKFMAATKENDDKLNKNLSTVFGRLRNTQQYWKIRRCDLNAMVDNYGPATFFLTLSPSEYHWDDLHEFLCRRNNISNKKSRTLNSLIAADPVSVSLFMDLKFKAMLDFLLADDGPLGKIEHYAWRLEYQSRGLQHFHIILWIRDAPVIGKSSPEEVANFINKYIVCRIPPKQTFPVLYDRVMKYQSHKHNSYCMRSKTNNNGVKKRVCRFGFPRKVCDGLILHTVAQAVYGRRKLTKTRLYDLPRNDAEVNINDYNPAVLLAWCGNMDIQFIGEKSCKLTEHITKYQTKPEKSFAADDFQNFFKGKSKASNLWRFAMKALTSRECGALEAADTLLQIHLFGTDKKTVIRWVNVSKTRNRKVKSKEQLEKMHDDDTEIFCPNMVDVHYPNRPGELADLNLYDFMRYYDIVNSEPKSKNVIWYTYGDQFLRKRSLPYLLNHYKYNPKMAPDNYYHSLLLLFKPWHSLDELKDGCDSYIDAFNKCKDDLVDAMRYHDKLTELREARDQFDEDMEKEKEKEKEKREQENEEDEENNILGFEIPLEAELNDMNNLAVQENDIPLESLIDQLNTDQRRIFDETVHCLNKYCKEWQETIDINKDNLKNPRLGPAHILRKFISGVGGTGKSFLINVIRKYVLEKLEKQVLVAGPTGIAARNVNGLTIHRLLNLPVQHGGVTYYTPLTDEKLQSLRQDFKNGLLLIIDEISMVSNVTLAFIHLRLSEIFDTKNHEDGCFGRINILFFGDLLQLDPVIEPSPFVDISSKQLGNHFAAVGTTNLWQFFTYDELTENVRQKSDQEFVSALNRIRLGFMSNADYELLSSRSIDVSSDTREGCLSNLVNYIGDLPAHTVCLFPKREQCRQLNAAMLDKIKSEKIVLMAEESSVKMIYKPEMQNRNVSDRSSPIPRK